MKTPAANSLDNDPNFSELQLDPVGGNYFIGHIDRVPFRMELVSNDHTTGLLFQTRFSKLKQPIPENVPVPSGSQLENLIAEKKAEFTADNDRAWFNLFAAHELLEQNQLIPVLKEFAAALTPYVDFDDQPCFACKQTKATQPIYHSEKLHLICDACQDQIKINAARLAKPDAAHIGYLALWAFAVSIIGGVIWALGWVGFDLIFGGRTISNFIFMLALATLALIVAAPIAFVFKKLPRRTPVLPKTILAFTCLIIFFFGESAYATYYYHKVFALFPNLDQTFRMWRWLMTESDALYVLGKLITLGCIWAFTHAWSTKTISLEQAAAPSIR